MGASVFYKSNRIRIGSKIAEYGQNRIKHPFLFLEISKKNAVYYIAYLKVDANS